MPALVHRGFREFITGSFVSNVGNTVQALAIAWHVYDLTKSSFMVGLLGLVRVIPMLVFTLFGGVVADQCDRRRVLLVTQCAMALVALAAFALSAGQHMTVGWLYVIVAANAVARAFDLPARQAMVAGLVPRDDYPNAASVNGMAWRLSDVLGPIIAGLLIARASLGSWSGLTLCYGLNFLSFLTVLLALLRLPPRPAEEQPDRARNFADVVSRIKDGLHFVRKTPVLRSAMLIDFWATLLSGADALLPAFAAHILKLGPDGYGILAAASGVGALSAAGTMAFLPTFQNQGRWVIRMIGMYGLATIAFGLSNSLVTAALSLAAIGAADMISTVLRQTIRQLATPDAMRGRMSATSSLFHISGPQLGDFEAGAVASAAGERVSIVLGGGLCLIVAGFYSRVKALADYKHDR